jgi:hypothetical protein
MSNISATSLTASSSSSQGTPANLPKPSSPFSSSKRRVPSVAPQIIVAPTNNRKDHCTYPGKNYQGGDVTDAQGGNGLETSDPVHCANECETRSVCQFWTYVDAWKVNCYLKSSFDEESSKEGATSGSIGVSCSSTYLKHL